jgi:hypothetical protein
VEGVFLFLASCRGAVGLTFPNQKCLFKIVRWQITRTHASLRFAMVLVVTISSPLFQSRAQESQASQTETDRTRALLREQMELQLQEQEKLLGEDDSSDDLGEQILVRRKPKPWNITFSSDIGQTWSSNVTQTDRETVSDWATSHNDAVLLSYRLSDQVSLNGAYRFSIFRYHRLLNQNFNVHNATTTLNVTLPYGFNAYTGAGWTSLYSRPARDAVFEEFDLNMGFNKVFPLNFIPFLKDKAAAFAGFQGDHRLTSPKELKKMEYAPFGGLFLAPLKDVRVQAVYRFSRQVFMVHSREDYNSSYLLSASWSPFGWMNVSSYASWAQNDSVGLNARPYEAFNTGTSVKFLWKF